MRMPDTILYRGIRGVVLLIGVATRAAGQGTSGPVIGGEARGLTPIRGTVLCGDGNLTDVREEQAHGDNLYRLTYPGGRLVFQREWVSEPQRWTDVISSPLLHARGNASVFEQLVAEENVLREVESTGLL